MKYLLISLLFIAGCSMSPREMLADCMTEVAPIGVKNITSFVDLQDDCLSKYKICITECYLEKEACSDAHENTITSCETYRKALVEKGEW